MNSFSSAFKKKFEKYKEKKIALYGIGKNAERILTNVNGYHIVCLIATEHIGETIHGKTVRSLENAINEAEVIIIAAIPQSTRVIYERIKDQIPDQILLLDLWGHLLNNRNGTLKDKYWEKRPKDLYDAIDRSDVVSFDIFDTLLLRKVLYPTDVYKLAEREVAPDGIPFARYREETEKRLGATASIEIIYNTMVREGFIAETVADTYRQKELEIERMLISLRKGVYRYLCYAKEKGKKIYLTSDMYHTAPFVRDILWENGITEYDELLISSEQNAEKSNGTLYIKICEKEKGKHILHIGDNRFADIEMAEESGIQGFYIMSVWEMLARSSVSYLLNLAHTLDDRVLLGTIAADLFDDPFVLCGTCGKILLKNPAMLGRLSIVPVVMRFVQFLLEKVEDTGKSIILFGSRDGFFLERVYQEVKRNTGKSLPTGCYFYISRTFAARAVASDREAVLTFCTEINERLNLNAYLYDRYLLCQTDEFNLTVADAIRRWGYAGLGERIWKRSEEIEKQTKPYREGVLKYCEDLQIERYNSVFYVDMVTRGTIVFCLRKLCKNPIHLVAFGGLSMPNKFTGIDEEADLLFGNDVASLEIYQWHPILELVLASKEDQLEMIDKDGKKHFVENTHYNPNLLDEIQDAMSAFLECYPDKEWYERELSDELVLGLLDTMHESHTDMSEELMDMFDFYDAIDADGLNKSNAMRRIRTKGRE